ncbi:MAG: tryptophan synthase subunit alpha [Thermomicrobiales bacterium]|nr:tryptophan synthase subunit alpha [Thermomicrobiales bacterium]
MTNTAPTRTNQKTTSRVTAAFARAKAEGRAAILPYVTSGWPELDDTERIVKGLVAGGADLIELGVPFSDPIADGPTIQRTSQRALDNGMTPDGALEIVRRLRASGIATPVLFMGYYNPVFAYGLDAFARACAEAGVDGLMIPDLPPEESDELLAACLDNGIHLVYFLAPTSTAERVEAVLQRANGFIYLISLTGVTGARDQLPTGLGDYVVRVRRHTQLPLAIGFGISKRDQVVVAEGLVDGVVCGTALLTDLELARPDELEERAAGFIRMLRGD